MTREARYARYSSSLARPLSNELLNHCAKGTNVRHKIAATRESAKVALQTAPKLSLRSTDFEVWHQQNHR